MEKGNFPWKLLLICLAIFINLNISQATEKEMNAVIELAPEINQGEATRNVIQSIREQGGDAYLVLVNEDNTKTPIYIYGFIPVGIRLANQDNKYSLTIKRDDSFSKANFVEQASQPLSVSTQEQSSWHEAKPEEVQSVSSGDNPPWWGIKQSLVMAGDIVMNLRFCGNNWQVTDAESFVNSIAFRMLQFRTVIYNKYKTDVTWIINWGMSYLNYNPVQTRTSGVSYASDPNNIVDWIGDALYLKGYNANRGGLRDWHESLLRQYGADGVATGFIVNDGADSCFYGDWGWINWASPYLYYFRQSPLEEPQEYRYGGGYWVSGRNAGQHSQSMGILVAPHEFFHCFGALDEYSSNCNTNTKSGLKQAPNGNCGGYEKCVMRNVAETDICYMTVSHLGIDDENGDGYPDGLVGIPYTNLYSSIDGVSPGDRVEIFTMADGSPVNALYVSNRLSIPSRNFPGKLATFWYAKNWSYQGCAPGVYYMKINSGDVKTLGVGGATLIPAFANFHTDGDTALVFGCNAWTLIKAEITKGSTIVRYWTGRFIVDRLNFGFLADGTYRYTLKGIFPAGPCSPVYTDTFNILRGAPKPPIITNASIMRLCPYNQTKIQLSDTNYYIDGVRLERQETGGQWQEVAASNILTITNQVLKGSTNYSWRSRSFNENGVSDYSNVVITKNAPNPPREVKLNVYQRVKNDVIHINHSPSLPNNQLFLKPKPDDEPDKVVTNRVDISWQPPQNQALTITYYKVKWAYMEWWIPIFGQWREFTTGQIDSLHYTLRQLPKDTDIEIYVYGFDSVNDSSALAGYTVHTGKYDEIDVWQPEENKNKIVSQPAMSFSLEQNYPNPFNSQTIIQYNLAHACHTKLEIYNIAGQKVITLVNRYQQPGAYQVNWDTKDQDGREVPSGIYLCRMSTDKFISTKKIDLIR